METLVEARKAYTGWGITSTGYRNSVMMAWGNLVGKRRSIAELDELIKKAGGKAKFAESIQLGIASLRKIAKYFEELPDDFEHKNELTDYEFVNGEHVSGIEEDLVHEFKEIRGNNPISTIQKKLVEYAVAFLNSEGGSVFWGISDDGIVKGIPLSVAERDKLRLTISNGINSIEPKLDPTQVTLRFHDVRNYADTFVVEVIFPKSRATRLYFNSSGDTWVRLDGCNQKLKGPALQDYIIRRMQKGN